MIAVRNSCIPFLLMGMSLALGLVLGSAFPTVESAEQTFGLATKEADLLPEAWVRVDSLARISAAEARAGFAQMAKETLGRAESLAKELDQKDSPVVADTIAVA